LLALRQRRRRGTKNSENNYENTTLHHRETPCDANGRRQTPCCEE